MISIRLVQNASLAGAKAWLPSQPWNIYISIRQ